MFNSQRDALNNNSAFRKLEGQETDATTSDLSHLGFAQEMMQVINAQHGLIAKLLQRQNTLYQELNRRFSSSGSSSGSVDQHQNGAQTSNYQDLNNRDGSGSGSPLDGSGSDVRNNVKIVHREGPLAPHCSNKREFIEDSNSSHFSEAQNTSQRKPNLRKRQTETKNMVKNFAKAIFGFIRKNKSQRNRVLSFLGFSEEEFMKAFNNLKGHVHSISELRALWTPHGNRYHQVFRIMSCQYLRKHCLERTFNSRVENYSVHLKYRQRLLEGIKSPEDFTILKTN